MQRRKLQSKNQKWSHTPETINRKLLIIFPSCLFSKHRFWIFICTCDPTEHSRAYPFLSTNTLAEAFSVSSRLCCKYHLQCLRTCVGHLLPSCPLLPRFCSFVVACVHLSCTRHPLLSVPELIYHSSLLNHSARVQIWKRVNTHWGILW